MTKITKVDSEFIDNVSGTAAGTPIQTSTKGFRSAVVQVVSAGTSNTIMVDGSNDGVTWH
jgi:hypothetical protein